MSRIVLNSPFLLGFEEIEDVLSKISKASDNYPPYNIEQYGEGLLIIKLAVAGFKEEDLSISQENNQLIIVGNKLDDCSSSGVIYLHRGISFRKFQKTFLLAEGVEPISSYIEDGILHVELKKEVPQKAIKIISIEKKTR